jgi:hypothetical protein
MPNKPAGGLGSRQVVKSRAPKVEPIPHKVSVAAVSQLGEAVAFKPEPLTAGRGYAEPQGPTSNMGQGPGANRVLYGQSGTQRTYGPTRGGEPDRAPDIPGTKPGKDILRDYGPESK